MSQNFFSYKEFIPTEFAPSSRIWIYQSNRLFTNEEGKQLQFLLNQFAENWKSHSIPVKGFAGVLLNRFIVLMADETYTIVSGCSTDSSVHFIRQLETQFHTSLFQREHLAFMIDNEIKLLPLSTLHDAFENGTITPNTLYFDNTVSTKETFMQHWLTPVKNSWIGNRFPLLQDEG
jgi:hypothetical protein